MKGILSSALAWRMTETGKTLTEKIISQHLVEGSIEPGVEIGIKIDHTLIQDSTGTMADLQFEAMDVPRVQTEFSVSFVDHNTLQSDYRNMDDHKYLQSVAAKYGLHFSRPGNGICHQVYLERFSKPGGIILGSYSHTSTAGGAGMLALGAGGLDVAAAMAGEPFYMKMPRVLGVYLTGSLHPFVSAKDVILKVLKCIGVKGAVGKVLEYHGPGVKTLSVPERGTITNMGTETGATSSIFPSDDVTLGFLRSQSREEQWTETAQDPDTFYDDCIEINLSELEPLIALPHSPGNVKTIREVEGIKVDQVCIGSCTNSSLRDLKIVAGLLKGKKIVDSVSLTVSPGSHQVLEHLAESGELSDILFSGARLLECACGPCIGMGQAPNTNAVSLRTFNRNFKGRSGTESAQVYLVSPEAAVAAALTGEIMDPRRLGDYPEVLLPDTYIIDDSRMIPPSEEPGDVEIYRGPNIRPLPDFDPLPDSVKGTVLLKLGDNVTTDDIMPAGAKILPLRSNIPEISKHVFSSVDPMFHNRAMEQKGGFLVGGDNYGQGSSREHAALAPRYLGVRAVLAKSYARIHEENLVNFGILPLVFSDTADYDGLDQGDSLEIDVLNLAGHLIVRNLTKRRSIQVSHRLADRDIDILKAGGKLPYIRSRRS